MAAAVEKQLQKGAVIARRREQAAVAGHVRANRFRVGTLDPRAVLPRVHRHHAVDLVRRHDEEGVTHVERCEDARPEKCIERLSGDLLDDASEDGGILAIGELVARIVQRRQVRGGFFPVVDLRQPRIGE